MKKIILAGLILSASLVFVSYTGRPLFGTASNQNNTGSILTYAITNIADTAGSTVDTITIIPNNFEKIYVLTLTDSCVVAIKSTASSFTGSVMTIIVENTSGSGHFANLLGYSGLATQWAVSSTGTKLLPASTKRIVITFICDGTVWLERSRVVQA